MAQTRDRLNALQVKNLSTRGNHADGAGLYLQVTKSGTKTWVMRFMLNGKAREMSLGSVNDVTLREARARRDVQRKLVRDEGKDPIEVRKQAKLAQSLIGSNVMTFDACAAAYIDAKSVEWTNEKHRHQWIGTIAQYAGPKIGGLNVALIETPQVMDVLREIWYTKTETASRLRGRIESILGWAKTSGYRTGDNPARWNNHLENLLPAKNKTQKVQHHPALPYSDINAFIQHVRSQEGEAPKALEFLILTASRTGEVIGARWDELDIEAATWTVPAARMKMKKEHRVPLTPRAVQLLQSMAETRQNEFVFPSRIVGKAVSNMAMIALLKRMNRLDITVHGFRSTFRDWAAAETNVPREIAEAALAHDIKSKVEKSYQRGDLFDKRRALMEMWANYCAQPFVKNSATVTNINRAAS